MGKSSVMMLMILAALPLVFFTWRGQTLEFPCNEVEGFGVESYPFCNQSLSNEVREADLVSRLNTVEKIRLHVNSARAVSRLGLPNYEWWNDGLHGMATSPGLSFNGPLLAATSFPQLILMAASFNRTLWNEIRRVVSLITNGIAPPAEIRIKDVDSLDTKKTSDEDFIGKEGRPTYLNSGAAIIPHPKKAAHGGEDAFFIEGACWIGVVDGVEGWANGGINAGLYAQELMLNCAEFVRDCEKDTNRKTVIIKSFSKLKDKVQQQL